MTTRTNCAVLLIAGASLLTIPAFAQPAPPRNNCLAYRDLEQLQAVNGTTAIARTRRDAYTVTFRGYCDAKATASYCILRQPQQGFCLDRGDVLDVSEPAAPCVVANVTYLRSLRTTGR